MGNRYKETQVDQEGCWVGSRAQKASDCQDKAVRRYTKVAVLLGYHEIKGNVKKGFTTVKAKLGSYRLVLSTT